MRGMMSAGKDTATHPGRNDCRARYFIAIPVDMPARIKI